MKLYTHAPAVVLYILHFKYNYSKEFSQLKSIKDFSFSSHLINSLSKGIKNPHTYIVSPKIHAWRNSLQGLVLKWIQIPEYIFCVKDVASGIDHAWPKSPIFLFFKIFCCSPYRQTSSIWVSGNVCVVYPRGSAC